MNNDALRNLCMGSHDFVERAAAQASMVETIESALPGFTPEQLRRFGRNTPLAEMKTEAERLVRGIDSLTRAMAQGEAGIVTDPPKED